MTDVDLDVVLPIRSFEQECEFMSAIRHPNTASSTWACSETLTHTCTPARAPNGAENDSLTHFLESSTVPSVLSLRGNLL